MKPIFTANKQTADELLYKDITYVRLKKEGFEFSTKTDQGGITMRGRTFIPFHLMNEQLWTQAEAFLAKFYEGKALCLKPQKLQKSL